MVRAGKCIPNMLPIYCMVPSSYQNGTIPQSILYIRTITAFPSSMPFMYPKCKRYLFVALFPLFQNHWHLSTSVLKKNPRMLPWYHLRSLCIFLMLSSCLHSSWYIFASTLLLFQSVFISSMGDVHASSCVINNTLLQRNSNLNSIRLFCINQAPFSKKDIIVPFIFKRFSFFFWINNY